jgi:signal transduction histidine kinase/response regulator RpfG family c-di-GMP phosphodiesterase
VSVPILSLAIRDERDVVAARRRARQITELLDFDVQDQTRVATAVSEIGRNAFTYAGGGKVDFLVEGKTSPQLFVVRIADQGPGIADLDRVLDGQYRSTTGMGLGILGTRRLMDHFSIESSPRGTVVSLKKLFSRRAPVLTPARAARIAAELAQRRPDNPLEEVQQQNQELIRTLEELRARQEDLVRLNAELEDTNRGVVALYAELDEKADHLRRADELKSRFLNNMSHEFRTPLNAIRALTDVLLRRVDGELTSEQEVEVGYIRKAVDQLSELVEDLLDLAKVEAGKISIRPAEFDVPTLFSSLRGMLRPLLINESVSLVFETAVGVPPLTTDEAKVSQILRNLVSNALKFTERGEVRIAATPAASGEAVVFSVADTGIGIAPEDQERIFQEFGQIDGPIQRRVRGTGLGLPLSRKLATLLGGTLTVESEPGVGSTFSATIPVTYVVPEPAPAAEEWVADPLRLPVLVVEDSPEEMLLYEKFLKGSGFHVVRAMTTSQARHALGQLRPVAIVLDILLRGEDAWTLLAELKRDPQTRDIPVLIVSTVDDRAKGLGLGADAYAVKPVERRWLLDKLQLLTGRQPVRRVLLIDDDEISRYLVRGWLDDVSCMIAEARGGEEGLRRARQDPPDAIVLDLVMPDVSGFEVLERLRADGPTQDIPVVVVTSKVLEDAERRRLKTLGAAAVVSKAADRDTAVTQLRSVLVGAGLVAP